MVSTTLGGHALNTTPQHLQATLRVAGRTHSRVQIGSAICRLLMWTCIGILTAIALDAILSLPPLALFAVDLILVTFVLVSVVRLGLNSNRPCDERNAARLLEEQLGLHGSQLINAIDLAKKQASGQSLELRNSTIQQGEQLATHVSPRKAIDKRPLQDAALRLAGICGFIGVLYLLIPGVFQSVIPRYVHPFANNAAYTLVNFEVEYPKEVLQGKPVVIKATLTGMNLPDRANIVFVDSQGSSASMKQPMLRLDGQATDSTAAPTTARNKSDSQDQPLIFAIRIDRASRTTDFYIDTPTGRSPTYRVNVLPVPRIEQITIRYDAPAYTGWKPQTDTLDKRGIRGFVGTTVTVVAKSNMPLRSGRLTLTPKDGETSPIALSPDPTTPTIVTGSFLLDESGSFKLSLTADNADNTATDEPATGTFTAIPDRAPNVQITEPTNSVIIAPVGWIVPVIVQAEDDVQIASLQLFVQRNEETGVYHSLDYEKSSRLVGVRHGIDLGMLGAKAGDKVMFFATVTDNHPDAPQSADSKRYVVHVISLEEYLDHARSKYDMANIEDEIDRFQKRLDEVERQRKAIEDALTTLNEKLNKQGGEPSQEDLDKLAAINQTLDEYAQEQLKLAEDMRRRAAQPKLHDMEEALKEMLQAHGDQLDDAAREAINLRQQYDKHRRHNPQDQAEAKRHIERLLDKLKRDAGEQQEAKKNTEAAQQDTKRIAAADRMATQVQRIQRVIEQQRDLADRLAPYKANESLSPAEQLRAQRLAHEQGALKDDLNQALDKLEQEASKAQNELPRMAASAAEIAEAIRNLKVLDDQTSAEQAAISGRGTESHQAAERAAKNLESLQDESEAMQGAASADLADNKFSLSKMKLGESLKQLAQGRGLARSLNQPNPTKGDNGGSVGSRSKVSVYGPHSAGDDSKRAKPGGHQGDDGNGGGDASNANQNVAAENLTPSESRTNRASAPGVRGVPAPYQELADQYLKRLADDAK